jgi:hypothetical protein
MPSLDAPTEFNACSGLESIGYRQNRAKDVLKRPNGDLGGSSAHEHFVLESS